MTKQVKSKQRVAERGEVFTAEREVNAMLDLVKQETQRIDSRFLEPACGDGNFLVEILRRKLAVVKANYKKNPADYEKYSVIAVTSIYGVDIMQDNVLDCRERLYKIWNKEYTANCKNEANDECRDSVKYILERNILCGNALSLLQVDENGNDTDKKVIRVPLILFIQNGKIVSYHSGTYEGHELKTKIDENGKEVKYLEDLTEEQKNQIKEELKQDIEKVYNKTCNTGC